MMKPGPLRLTGKTKAIFLIGLLFLSGTIAVLLGTRAVSILSLNPYTGDWRSGTQRVASVGKWYPVSYDPFYHWISETEVLFIEMETVPHYRRILKKCNTVTGVVSTVAILPRIFMSSLRAYGLNNLQVSPDGNSLLWWDVNRKKVYTIGVLDLRRPGDPQGVKTWVFSEVTFRIPYWLPDSSGWFDGNRAIYSLKPEKSRKVSDYPLDLFRPLGRLADLAFEEFDLYEPLLGQLPGGDWLVGRNPGASRRKVTQKIIARLVAASNRKPGSPREIESIVTRSDTTYELIPLALSPDATKIVWAETRARNPWQYETANWLTARGWNLPHHQWDIGSETILFTTDVQGGKPRHLGVMPEAASNVYLLTIRWTPDGKAVSFVHDGALYVRPVR